MHSRTHTVVRVRGPRSVAATSATYDLNANMNVNVFCNTQIWRTLHVYMSHFHDLNTKLYL